MLFFQLILLGGYAYAHIINRFLSSRLQSIVHIVLLGSALLVLPVIPGESWKPESIENPTFHILLLLLVTVGLPYFMVSTTGPLLQAWFAKRYTEKSPYPLYALSNLGSLFALVSYPFLVEPLSTRRTQAIGWSIAFLVFALFCAYITARVKGVSKKTAASKNRVPIAIHEDNPIAKPEKSIWLMWIGLPTFGSILLLATTNQMCLDVASIPFLWVLPLSLYLITFIVSFSSSRLYFRPVFFVLLVISMAAMMYTMKKGLHAELLWQVAAYCGGLFVCDMVLHSELYRLRPHPKYLTSFYLAVSLGGALGGVFVGLLAPLIFSAYFELHIAMLGTAILAYIAFYMDKSLFINRGWYRLAWIILIGGLVTLTVFVFRHRSRMLRGSLEASRNFYGILRVRERFKKNPEKHRLELAHGITEHGMQFKSEEKRKYRTTYYGKRSGAGLAISNFPGKQKKRVGVVGLGVGTLTAYAEKGDYYRIYEINYDVKRISQKHFTYLKDCRGKYDIVMGDARLSMERELARNEPQQFDILILDAFSSDAIPVHLLTKEAFIVYMKHVKRDGVIAVHISNRHLQLRPVVWGISEKLKLESVVIRNGDKPKYGVSDATWMLVTKNKAFLEIPKIKRAARKNEKRNRKLKREYGSILWTDNYTNLFGIATNVGTIRKSLFN